MNAAIRDTLDSMSVTALLAVAHAASSLSTLLVAVSECIGHPLLDTASALTGLAETLVTRALALAAGLVERNR
jgi:hypothetical protein